MASDDELVALLAEKKRLELKREGVNKENKKNLEDDSLCFFVIYILESGHDRCR